MKNKIPESKVTVTICTCWNCGAEEQGEAGKGSPIGWLSAGISQQVEAPKDIHTLNGWETKVSANSRFCCLKCMIDYISTEVR